MAYHRSAQRSADGCDALERRVQEADTLVRQTLLSLFRGRPPGGSLGAAAYDALVGLRPRVRGALDALEDIERLRHLTDEELARRHAFRMLLYPEARSTSPRRCERGPTS